MGVVCSCSKAHERTRASAGPNRRFAKSTLRSASAEKRDPSLDNGSVVAEQPKLELIPPSTRDSLSIAVEACSKQFVPNSEDESSFKPEAPIEEGAPDWAAKDPEESTVLSLKVESVAPKNVHQRPAKLDGEYRHTEPQPQSSRIGISLPAEYPVEIHREETQQATILNAPSVESNGMIQINKGQSPAAGADMETSMARNGIQDSSRHGSELRSMSKKPIREQPPGQSKLSPSLSESIEDPVESEFQVKVENASDSAAASPTLSMPAQPIVVQDPKSKTYALSSFSTVPVLVGKRSYASVEAAYQASKFEDEMKRDALWVAAGPWMAMSQGQTWGLHVRSEWLKEGHEHVLQALNSLKVLQNEHVKQILMDSQNSKIIALRRTIPSYASETTEVKTRAVRFGPK